MSKAKQQTNEPFTGVVFKDWAELKAFANTLSPDQLKQPVRYWGDGHAGVIASVHVLNEDYVQVDQYAEPRSTHEKPGSEYHKLELDAYTVYPKGTMLLATDELELPLPNNILTP